LVHETELFSARLFSSSTVPAWWLGTNAGLQRSRCWPSAAGLRAGLLAGLLVAAATAAAAAAAGVAPLPAAASVLRPTTHGGLASSGGDTASGGRGAGWHLCRGPCCQGQRRDTRLLLRRRAPSSCCWLHCKGAGRQGAREKQLQSLFS